MDKKEVQEAIKLMQAWLDGEEIQYRTRRDVNQDWQGYEPDECRPSWNWHVFEYRAKPMPLEVWLVLTADGATYTYFDSNSARLSAATKFGSTITRLREVTDET